VGIGQPLCVIDRAWQQRRQLRSIVSGRALVEGDMVSLDALDLILRSVGVRVMGTALVLDITRMHANDLGNCPTPPTSPKIIQAIAGGTASAGLTVSRLTQALPHAWTARGQMLGLS
jgi:hypothetical protein